MEGVKRLPWDGYKKAILASHTSYVSKNNFIIENHGIKISSRSLNSIKNGSLNVYGCHLSGKPKGEPHACPNYGEDNSVLEYA